MKFSLVTYYSKVRFVFTAVTVTKVTHFLIRLTLFTLIVFHVYIKNPELKKKKL